MAMSVRSPAAASARSSSGTAVARPSFSSRRPVSACSALKSSTQQVEEQSPQAKGMALGLMAMASAAALVLAPMDAQAVSGGGGISTPISGQDFSGQDLRKNKYTKAVMRQTNFSNANLSGVSFFGGLAIGANFHGANLSNADLESADLEGADLSDAILAGAFVNNAQFKDNNIKGSDWTDVVLRKDVQKYLCSIAEGTNPVTGVDTRESLFCP